MFLKIVALALDVSHDRLSVCQFNTGDFSFSRVGFFWSPNHNLCAYALPLGTLLQEWGSGERLSTRGRLFAFHGLVHRSES